MRTGYGWEGSRHVGLHERFVLLGALQMFDFYRLGLPSLSCMMLLLALITD